MQNRLYISDKMGVKIHDDMIGLFFEDINYAADGGLYAEMIENRSFEFVDCCGGFADYYVKNDSGYGWYPTDLEESKMEYVMGSPVNRNNPHYLRFTAMKENRGFWNKAYDGISLKKGASYKISFYARAVSYNGDIKVLVIKNGTVRAEANIAIYLKTPENSLSKWNKYELELTANENVRGGQFTIMLSQKGTVEFDFISMMPKDAVAGIFRKDLFDLLKDLKPGFLRFPGGCIVEGNTLENRYRWKESVGVTEGRRANFNRWAVHGTSEEKNWHTCYSHYNQTLGLGFYEYFLLCEMIGAKPLPVVNVGLACQYQSYELVEINDPAFKEFLQDALDLIEFANGKADTYWGRVRVEMGHPEPFGLTMLGIGNEQWQTEKSDFFERYEIFETAIHKKYPEIRLIGSAGPDITSEKYKAAWEFYRKKAPGIKNFCYAIDEHYYVKPEWFYEHTDFYDEYPRDIKVFSGEYAAHPASGMNMPEANTLGGALAEAAFLTGVERNADVVVLASYAPLFARTGYAQWSPDMIWFDDVSAYKTPSYYVQKLYSENMGTDTVFMNGQEKLLRENHIYANVSYDGRTGEYIVKAVNSEGFEQKLEIAADRKADNAATETGNINGAADSRATANTAKYTVLAGRPEDCNSILEPDKIIIKEKVIEFDDSIILPANSFVVLRFKI